jgi:hypothetical protein
MVTGSRGWEDPKLIYDIFSKLGARHNQQVTLIHGGASGADTQAAAVADALGWDLPPADIPNWRPNGVYDPQAGHKRNLAMLNKEPDLVVAFWDGRSRGTLHAIAQARWRAIPTLVVSPDGSTRTYNCKGADDADRDS